MATATLVQDKVKSVRNGRLYRLDPPIRQNLRKNVVHKVVYVVVSAVNAPITGDETYIFPSNEKGDILDWLELDGSFRGSQDHTKALNNAGYVVVHPNNRNTELES